jgi:hypothetical protein
MQAHSASLTTPLTPPRALRGRKPGRFPKSARWVRIIIEAHTEARSMMRVARHRYPFAEW